MSDSVTPQIQLLEQSLRQQTGLAFAVLVGSQRTGQAHAQSDWDIAVQWREALGLMEKLAQTELLRHELKNLLNVEEQQVDLIDTAHARLAMRALLAVRSHDGSRRVRGQCRTGGHGGRKALHSQSGRWRSGQRVLDGAI